MQQAPPETPLRKAVTAEAQSEGRFNVQHPSSNRRRVTDWREYFDKQEGYITGRVFPSFESRSFADVDFSDQRHHVGVFACSLSIVSESGECETGEWY